MKVGVIQSNYIPWRGYFDFIDSVDLFVFHDDLQYTKNDWRNRNRILTPAGPRWLTVPVSYKHVEQKIDEVPIDYHQNWAARHIEQLSANYRRAPFFQDYVHQFGGIIDEPFPSISELNVAVCKWIMQVLDIRTPVRMSRELAISGKKSERLIDLLTKVGGTTYVSGPSASAYLDLDLFRRHGIRVEYKSYDYPEYPQIQMLQTGFSPAVSALDLLFNTGPEARRYLKSGVPNQLAA
jgi:hypothetical protein